MLTVEQRIAQVRQRAAARGLTATGSARPPIVREPRKQEPSKPLTKLELALDRPLPEITAPSTWPTNKGEGLRRVRSRLAAWLVARALGPDWYLADYQHDDYWMTSREIVHRPTKAVLCWRIDYQNHDRISISPKEAYDRCFASGITVSATRSPASIAKDIQRRIVDAGLSEQLEKRRDADKTRRDRDIMVRRRVLAATLGYGGRMRKGYNHTHRTEYSGTEEVYNGTRIEAAANYRDEVTLTIESDNLELLAKIGELVRNS